MMPTFAPVQARTTDWAAGVFDCRDIDAELGKKRAAWVREAGFLAVGDKPLSSQTIKQYDPLLASEMVIAPPGNPQRLIARPRPHPHRTGSLSKPHQRL